MTHGRFRDRKIVFDIDIFLLANLLLSRKKTENQKAILRSLFPGHGIMAHIPWPLSQSNPWNNDTVFNDVV